MRGIDSMAAHADGGAERPTDSRFFHLAVYTITFFHILAAQTFTWPPQHKDRYRSRTMVIVSESRHPKSLHFRGDRKVVILRDTKKKGNKKLPWADIAKQVRNLQGKTPSPFLVAKVYKEFQLKQGRRVYKYENCGQQPSKVTEAVEKFVVKKMLHLRKNTFCTSPLLARALVKEKGIVLENSTIRKILARHDYHWLPRSQKPKYDERVRKLRKSFSDAFKKLTVNSLGHCR